MTSIKDRACKLQAMSREELIDTYYSALQCKREFLETEIKDTNQEIKHLQNHVAASKSQLSNLNYLVSRMLTNEELRSFIEGCIVWNDFQP